MYDVDTQLFNIIYFSLSHQEGRTSRFLSFLTRPTNYSGLMSHYHQDHHSHHQDLLPRDPKFLTSLTSLMDSLLPTFTRRLPKPQMFVDLRRATLKPCNHCNCQNQPFSLNSWSDPIGLEFQRMLCWLSKLLFKETSRATAKE